ncbi:MAG: colicin V production protein [Flavobacteriaceae bacterium]|nr:colicin V production protein [Flavobacteriaceae bacterium]
MNYFDLAILIIISIGIFRGLIKGFIIEVSSLISLYFGIVGSINYSEFLSSYIFNYTKWNETTINIICFILVFIIIVWSIMLIARFITKILKIAYLGLLNRAFGAVFGGVKWLVILSGIIIIFTSINEIITIPNKFLEDSFSYNILLDFGNFIFDWTSNTNWNIKNKII